MNAKVTETLAHMQAAVDVMNQCAGLFSVLSRGDLTTIQLQAIADTGKMVLDDYANVLDCAREELAAEIGGGEA